MIHIVVFFCHIQHTPHAHAHAGITHHAYRNWNIFSKKRGLATPHKNLHTSSLFTLTRERERGRDGERERERHRERERERETKREKEREREIEIDRERET